jgi:hypothetical protein
LVPNSKIVATVRSLLAVPKKSGEGESDFAAGTLYEARLESFDLPLGGPTRLAAVN